MNIEQAKELIQDHYVNYVNLSDDLKDNPEIALLAIQEGMNPLSLSEKMRDNEIVATEFLTQCGEYFGLCSERLMENKEIIKVAVADYPLAIRWVKSDVIDEELALFALQACTEQPDDDEVELIQAIFNHFPQPIQQNENVNHFAFSFDLSTVDILHTLKN